jgi:hypothetical protein
MALSDLIKEIKIRSTNGIDETRKKENLQSKEQEAHSRISCKVLRRSQRRIESQEQRTL